MDQMSNKNEIVFSNADEVLEKLFTGITALMSKETCRHETEQSDRNDKKIAGKLQYLNDKLAGVEEEQKAREKLKDKEYLSENARLKLEASALNRQIAGYKLHKEYYTDCRY
jgi:hypothetical protein